MTDAQRRKLEAEIEFLAMVRGEDIDDTCPELIKTDLPTMCRLPVIGNREPAASAYVDDECQSTINTRLPTRSVVRKVESLIGHYSPKLMSEGQKLDWNVLKDV